MRLPTRFNKRSQDGELRSLGEVVYPRRVKNKKLVNTFLVVASLAACLIGLLAAVHFNGSYNNAHAYLFNSSNKASFKVNKATLKDKKRDPKCLSYKTFDPRRCKRYGSDELY